MSVPTNDSTTPGPLRTEAALESGTTVPPATPRNGSDATGAVAGIVCGALLLLTAAIPWGMFGEKPLWAWNLFNMHHPFSFKAMLVSAWAAGLVTLVAGILLRNTGRSIAYLLMGGLAVGFFIAAFHGSPSPWLMFMPIPRHVAWLQSLGFGSVALFLVITGVRGLDGTNRSVGAIQKFSAICVTLVVGLALYEALLGETAARHSFDLQRRLHLAVVTVATGLAWWGCLLAFRTERTSSDAAQVSVRAGRRLVLGALLVLLIWGLLEVAIDARRFSAILGSLNNGILLTGISLLTVEGLSGVFTQLVPARRPGDRLPLSSDASGVAGARSFAEPWVLSWRFPCMLASVSVLLVAIASAVCLTSAGSSMLAPSPSASWSERATEGSMDWPQWCGGPERNMVSNASGLPERFDSVTSERTTGLTNVKWVVRLGEMTMGSPVIGGGKVLVGGMEKGRTGVLWCFRESDGQLLWRMRSPVIPMLYGRDSYGLCSTPTLEDDRLYVVGHLGDVLCLSANGLAAGNRGPFVDEAGYFASGRTVLEATLAPDGTRLLECSPGTPAVLGPLDADILWRFDLIGQANCWPYNALSSAILVRGERLYVATCSTLSSYGDGSMEPVEQWKRTNQKTSFPSPALIVLEKNTGRLLAKENAGLFDQTFHGAHASPTLGTVNGKELLFYGGGNGTCYAFDPEFEPGTDGRPGELKLVWKFDSLNPASYSAGFGLERLQKAETIATPVFYKNRIYTSIGNDLARSGPSAKQGRLVCIDATKTGDITNTGRIWSFDEMRSTASTVAIADGLLYTADASGVVYCMDAETGALYWTHHTGPVWGSPLVADGKVFVGTHLRGFLILSHSREKKVLFESREHEDFVASPAVANGVLYVASQKYLYALEQGQSGGLVEHGE